MLGGVVLIAQSKLKHLIYFCLYGVNMKYKVEIFLAFKKCNKRCKHFFWGLLNLNFFEEFKLKCRPGMILEYSTFLLAVDWFLY